MRVKMTRDVTCTKRTFVKRNAIAVYIMYFSEIEISRIRLTYIKDYLEFVSKRRKIYREITLDKHFVTVTHLSFDNNIN